ncbi:17964_t:CDS:2, partial [Acaulospora morrowiae]
ILKGSSSSEEIPKANQSILQQNNLFHPLSKSPIKEINNYGSLIRKFGRCPGCEIEGLKEKQNRPSYECPDCGYPTHCSYEHYNLDLVHHKTHVCELLREANEDEHDLRSGRKMVEFEFPGPQPLDEKVNMLTWDTFFYTRGFPSMDSQRSIRHVSKSLTYPITIASVLHEQSPYTTRYRLTNEGLKSLTALRITLHPKQTAYDIKTLQPKEVVRIFILGARAEAQLPLYLYTQLSHLFPAVPFHIHFVGPEALPKGTEPHTTHYNHCLSFTWKNFMYHDYHDALVPFDPYFDVFFLFSPGIGQTDGKQLWGKTIKKLLQTKCAIFITGFNEDDVKAEVEAIENDDTLEFDWLLEPGENVFRSLKSEINLEDVRIRAYSNWGILGIRGKRYDVRTYEERDEHDYSNAAHSSNRELRSDLNKTPTIYEPNLPINFVIVRSKINVDADEKRSPVLYGEYWKKRDLDTHFQKRAPKQPKKQVTTVVADPSDNSDNTPADVKDAKAATNPVNVGDTVTATSGIIGQPSDVSAPDGSDNQLNGEKKPKDESSSQDGHDISAGTTVPTGGVNAAVRKKKRKEMTDTIVATSATAWEQQNNTYKKTEESSKNTYTVIKTYIPTLSDELDIQLGDKVTILEVYDDGWVQGINDTRGGVKGVFPLNCVDMNVTPNNKRSSSNF